MSPRLTTPSSIKVCMRWNLEGATNGDGFGLGWYSPRESEPGIYREIRPAWSDDNVRNLCRHIRSSFSSRISAHRTGTATTRPNCHPFSYGPWMFMHNGSIGEWPLIRRQVEALIDDKFYPRRFGTTDSEAVFLAILSAGTRKRSGRRDRARDVDRH